MVLPDVMVVKRAVVVKAEGKEVKMVVLPLVEVIMSPLTTRTVSIDVVIGMLERSVAMVEVEVLVLLALAGTNPWR